MTSIGKPNVDETKNPWTTVESRVAYENNWISVRHDKVRDPSGRDGIYGVMSPKNFALGVLPLFDDGSTLLVGQYRYALDQYSWEIPEGGGPFAEDPELAIARELAEETGYRARHWHLLPRMSLSNSVTDEWAMTWLAWELTAGESEPESTEQLAIWRIPMDELREMIWNGTVFDSMTVAAVALLDAGVMQRRLPEPILAMFSVKN
jgi:8-oxo-dGTP pyrophosphatase MutT (NUDIX family)